MSDSFKFPNSGSAGAVGGEESPMSSESTGSRQVSRDYQWTRFLRELAGILVLCLHIPDRAWAGLLRRAGLSRIDLDEVTTRDLDPEIQVYKLLSQLRQQHPPPDQEGASRADVWWDGFARVVADFGNDSLTKSVQRAYDKFIAGDTVESLESDKLSSPQQSVVGASPKASNGQSFELINDEDVVRRSDDLKANMKDEIEVIVPGASQRIDDLQRTVHQVAKDCNSKLAINLAGSVTDTLHLENSFRATQTQKNILERETEMQKKNIIRLTLENESQSRELDTLRQENEELKKTKADQHLTEFDVITKREASQAQVEGSTTKPAPNEDINVVSLDAYKELQGRCLKVTSQRDQLVKVNHQWDAEYHQMESTLRAEHQAIVQTVAVKDEEIMAGKRLIVAIEREKADGEKRSAEIARELHKLKGKFEPLQEKCQSEKEKCRRYYEYAIRLKEQKDRMEGEIARLNQVLSDVKQLRKERSGKNPGSDQNADLELELGLFRQQAELYEKDFREEQREKQRLAGELTRVKQELRAMKRKMKKMDEKVQMAQDEQLAHQLQEEAVPEEATGRRNRIRSQDGLLPHGGGAGGPGLNFAGNDQFVDTGPISSFGSIEADHHEAAPQHAPLAPAHHPNGGEGVNYAGNDEYVDAAGSPAMNNPSPSGSVEGSNDEGNECPRCQRIFVEDSEFHNHLGNCLNE